MNRLERMLAIGISTIGLVGQLYAADKTEPVMKIGPNNGHHYVSEWDIKDANGNIKERIPNAYEEALQNAPLRKETAVANMPSEYERAKKEFSKGKKCDIELAREYIVNATSGYTGNNQKVPQYIQNLAKKIIMKKIDKDTKKKGHFGCDEANQYAFLYKIGIRESSISSTIKKYNNCVNDESVLAQLALKK
ncbi:MAG TPA: hypothetical protein VKE88_03490 [Candidatus Nanoarchaeia archaeon]|nr:hypothetical protein [Candidatus Nanoarchaeia archaeon]